MAAAASSRYQAAGVNVPLQDLQVLDLGGGEIIIAPEYATDLVVETARDMKKPSMSATARVGNTLDQPEGVVSASEGDVQLTAAAYWSRREGGCFSRKWVDSAWLDACYEISKLINDADGSVDFYGLEYWATIGETQFGLRHAWLESWRVSGSTTQNWYRWSPGSDLNGNCRDIPVVVVVKSAAIGSTFQQCEGWDMTKSANGTSPYFKNQWQCNCSFMVGGNREVAYTITVTVSQGKYPSWTLGWGMAA